MKLSKNFSLSEFTKSQTATRFGIENNPADWQIANLKLLCEQILQPARDALGPIVINSGFRSYALNRAIGGSASSQHCVGEAVDIECPGKSNLELAQWISQNCLFDQLILEGFTGEPNSGWVHVSLKSSGANRKEQMTATFKGGRAVYAYVNMAKLAA